MPRKVEKIISAYGIEIKGNMCENYTCRRCGVKATSCSFINGKPIQIFVPHSGSCAAYNDDNPYASNYGGISNSCPTCKYEGPDSTCLYEDMMAENSQKSKNEATKA